jgi:purine nucleoside permease
MQALTQLAKGGHMDIYRVLLLRAGSDYTIEPSNVSAADFLAKETKDGFPATPEALDSLYAVASPVVKLLTDDWAHTRATIPGGP